MGLFIFKYYKVSFILLVMLLLTACSTTNTNKQVVTPVSNDIVISEEYGIDTALNDKFNTAVGLIKEEKYQQAIDLLVEVTDKTNKHSAPYINLAIAYSELGKVKDAERILLRALKINPQHPVTNNELGLLYRKTGQFSKAKKIYENIINVYPQFLPARKNLGILCDIFMANLECAISQYEAFLKYQPDNKKMKIWLVDLKRRAGR